MAVTMSTTGQPPQTHLDQVAEGDSCGEHQVEMEEQLQQSGKDRTNLQVLLKLQNKKYIQCHCAIDTAAAAMHHCRNLRAAA